MRDDVYDFRGLLCRPGTLDEFVVREQAQYAGLGITDGDSVLDMGANIGAFARYAIEQGSHDVTSYEPEPENFELLTANTRGFEVLAIRLAVVPDGGPAKLELYVNGLKNKGSHTILETRGRDSVTVKTVSFSEVFEVPYDVVKIDIEGAEMQLPLHLIECHALAVEFHLNKRGHRQLARQKIEQINAVFKNTVKAPRVGDKNWTTVGIWNGRK